MDGDIIKSMATIQPSLLRTSAAPGAFVGYNVSRVSLTPADTNWFLTRGQPFNVGHYASSPLQGFHGALEGCTSHGCAVPPGDFCRQLVCPPLTTPIAGVCMGTVEENGKRVPVASRPDREG